jgi:hypothetical protein
MRVIGVILGALDHVMGPVGAPDQTLRREIGDVAGNAGDVGAVGAAGPDRLIAAGEFEPSIAAVDQGFHGLDLNAARGGALVELAVMVDDEL